MTARQIGGAAMLVLLPALLLIANRFAMVVYP